MAEGRRCGLTPQLDIRQILSEAPQRWLRPAEICEILRNYNQFRIESEPPHRPPSGTLFLFDRKVLRYFRKDGHNWRKKKDGKTVKEAHERLKSGSVDVLHCYYAHGEESANFQRRSYWMLEEDLMHIVLVHYREVKDKKETYSRTRDIEEFTHGGFIDSPGGSNSGVNSSQITSPATEVDSRNSAHTSEFEDTENDKSQACSRYHPFSEVRSFHEHSLTDPCHVNTYFISPQNTHGHQLIQPSGCGFDYYAGDSGLTTFDGSIPPHDLPPRSESHLLGMQDPVSLTYISSAQPFNINNHGSNETPVSGTYSHVHVSEQKFTEDIPWQDMVESAAVLPVVQDMNTEGSSGNEMNPMFSSLLKQLSLDLPSADGDKSIQKNDSFSKWASKELGEVNGLNSKTGIHWDELENEAMVGHSCFPSVDVMSPSLSKDQLFSIVDIYPRWSFAGSEIMVFVSGSFLVNKDDITRYNWSCMFGLEEVPAEVVADGVLQCLSPACGCTQVPFYVTCSNRLACSEIREFEFRDCREKDLEIYDLTTLNTNEMMFYTYLDKMLSAVPKFHYNIMPDFSTEKANMYSKISSLLLGTNDELSLVLKKANDIETMGSEKPNDQLMQTLLKDKLHSWLLTRVLEGGKGPSILGKEGQGVIHLAAALGYNWAIAPLIAAGLSINFRDIHGWTALHWAASYGRESTIVALLSLGANPGALTDPTPKFPSGRTPADLASRNGHKGIAGFLAESSLTTHLSTLNLKESGGQEPLGMPILGTSGVSQESRSSWFGDRDREAQLSLKDSLSAVRNAAQAAARIYQVYRVHSFHRKKVDEYGGDNFRMSDERALSLISIKANRTTAQYDEPVHSAAVKIQKKFRGWKGRKDFLTIRQHVVKIQAHVRGYQVRKHFRKIVWSVGIVEKAILRWRRKGCGLRGFRSEGSVEGTTIQGQPIKEDDYDFLRKGRKQTEERLERALARVKSMVQYPEAREQYRRLLTGVEEFQESKVMLERILNDEETDDVNMMFDIDELIGDDSMM